MTYVQRRTRNPLSNTLSMRLLHCVTRGAFGSCRYQHSSGYLIETSSKTAGFKYITYDQRTGKS